MTRKQMFATVTLAILGAGGLAYAADDANPLLKIAQAIQLIDDNTAAIADQTSTITKQTTLVVQQNAAIATDTAALAKANLQLDQKLDSVLNAIGKIEVPPPAPAATPASPAHAVWLAPYVDERATVDYVTLPSAFVLNAGVVPAKYTCNYFNTAGTRLLVHESTFTIAPGSIGTCLPRALSTHIGIGWLLIASDNPVIATGKNARREDGSFSTAENMPFRPLDCSGDQIGIEFVCDAVEAIQQGK